MIVNTLPTFALLAKRYWISTYQPDTIFTVSEEEREAFRQDFLIYLKHIRTTVCDTLDMRKKFSVDDLLCHLYNVEQNLPEYRYMRIAAICAETTDEEFRCLAELITTTEIDLSNALEELKIYLIIKIWNSYYSFYDPKTELLINHFLSDDHAFHEILAENCAKGIYNPGFCRWIITNWHLCHYYHESLQKALPARCWFKEQSEIAELIKKQK